MPAPRQRGERQRLFINRRSRDPVNAPGLRIAHGTDDGLVRRPAGIAGRAARCERLLGSVIEGLANFKDTRIGHSLPGYFWAYTRWVTSGDADSRYHSRDWGSGIWD